MVGVRGAESGEGLRYGAGCVGRGDGLETREIKHQGETIAYVT